MKLYNLLPISLIGIFCNLGYSQTNEMFAAYGTSSSVSLVSGLNYNITISGFQGNSRSYGQPNWLKTDVLPGDKVFLSCNQYTVVSISSTAPNLIMVVSKTDAPTPAPTNSQPVALLREYLYGTSSLAYALPQSGDGNGGAIAGIPISLQACIRSHYEQKSSILLGQALTSALEVAFTSGASVPATSVATVDGFRLAKNSGGLGTLFSWNGSAWIAVGTGGESTTLTATSTIQNVGTLPNLQLEVINGSITPAKLSQTYLTTEVDGSVSNELQNLSLSGSSLSISSGTGVTLPVVGITAGTNITTSTTAGVVTINTPTKVADGTTLSGTGATLDAFRLGQNSATLNQINKWNGTTWVAQDDNDGCTQTVTVTANGWAVGQTVRWNGTAWVLGTSATSGSLPFFLITEKPDANTLKINGCKGGYVTFAVTPALGDYYLQTNGTVTTSLPSSGIIYSVYSVTQGGKVFVSMDWLNPSASGITATAPLSGTGTSLDPIKINNGTATGHVLTWNGTAWGSAAASGGGATYTATSPAVVTGTVISVDTAQLKTSLATNFNVDTVSVLTRNLAPNMLNLKKFADAQNPQSYKMWSKYTKPVTGFRDIIKVGYQFNPDSAIITSSEYGNGKSDDYMENEAWEVWRTLNGSVNDVILASATINPSITTNGSVLVFGVDLGLIFNGYGTNSFITMPFTGTGFSINGGTNANAAAFTFSIVGRPDLGVVVKDFYKALETPGISPAADKTLRFEAFKNLPYDSYVLKIELAGATQNPSLTDNLKKGYIVSSFTQQGDAYPLLTNSFYFYDPAKFLPIAPDYQLLEPQTKTLAIELNEVGKTAYYAPDHSSVSTTWKLPSSDNLHKRDGVLLTASDAEYKQTNNISIKRDYYVRPLSDPAYTQNIAEIYTTFFYSNNAEVYAKIKMKILGTDLQSSQGYFHQFPTPSTFSQNRTLYDNNGKQYAIANGTISLGAANEPISFAVINPTKGFAPFMTIENPFVSLRKEEREASGVLVPIRKSPPLTGPRSGYFMINDNNGSKLYFGLFAGSGVNKTTLPANSEYEASMSFGVARKPDLTKLRANAGENNIDIQSGLKITDLTDMPGSYGANQVPFANNAGTAMVFGKIGSNNILNGGVTSANIADGTITFADLGQNSATANQVPKWNGTAWVAAADNGKPFVEAITSPSTEAYEVGTTWLNTANNSYWTSKTYTAASNSSIAQTGQSSPFGMGSGSANFYYQTFTTPSSASILTQVTWVEGATGGSPDSYTVEIKDATGAISYATISQPVPSGVGPTTITWNLSPTITLSANTVYRIAFTSNIAVGSNTTRLYGNTVDTYAGGSFTGGGTVVDIAFSVSYTIPASSTWIQINAAGGGSTVTTNAPLTGDGSVGSPVRFATATQGQTLQWQSGAATFNSPIKDYTSTAFSIASTVTAVPTQDIYSYIIPSETANNGLGINQSIALSVSGTYLRTAGTAGIGVNFNAAFNGVSLFVDQSRNLANSGNVTAETVDLIFTRTGATTAMVQFSTTAYQRTTAATTNDFAASDAILLTGIDFTLANSISVRKGFPLNATVVYGYTRTAAHTKY